MGSGIDFRKYSQTVPGSPEQLRVQEQGIAAAKVKADRNREKCQRIYEGVKTWHAKMVASRVADDDLTRKDCAAALLLDGMKEVGTERLMLQYMDRILRLYGHDKQHLDVMMKRNWRDEAEAFRVESERIKAMDPAAEFGITGAAEEGK